MTAENIVLAVLAALWFLGSAKAKRHNFFDSDNSETERLLELQRRNDENPWWPWD